MPLCQCHPGLMTRGELLIDNARIVTPDGVIDAGSLEVADGRIARIRERSGGNSVCRIDARGLLLLPGFVDVHSDAIETTIQPRPGGRFPYAMAITELDKQLVSCGITTIYHCLSFSDPHDKTLRGYRTCAELIREINRRAPKLRAATKVHARFEVTETAALPIVEELLAAGEVHLFSLMDHTPGQGQFLDVEHFRSYYGRVRGRTPAQLDALIEERLAARRELDELSLHRITVLALERGVAIASHDDDTPQKVAWVQRLGATLSEFPVNLAAARAAHERGMAVSYGAPNVFRGASATNNLNARESIGAGFGDIICSDYAPMSLLHAALALDRLGIVPLHEAANMISRNPARVVGIALETGSLEEGKAADLVLVDDRDDVPRVVRTFVGGREVFAS
jgi:alpha-D-ribose 1-methylphosphonate 5-triphosphate diphosphatase